MAVATRLTCARENELFTPLQDQHTSSHLLQSARAVRVPKLDVSLSRTLSPRIRRANSPPALSTLPRRFWGVLRSARPAVASRHHRDCVHVKHPCPHDRDAGTAEATCTDVCARRLIHSTNHAAAAVNAARAVCGPGIVAELAHDGLANAPRLRHTQTMGAAESHMASSQDGKQKKVMDVDESAEHNALRGDRTGRGEDVRLASSPRKTGTSRPSSSSETATRPRASCRSRTGRSSPRTRSRRRRSRTFAARTCCRRVAASPKRR